MNFKKIFIILLSTVLFVSSLSAQYVGKEFIFAGLVEYDESGNKIHEKGEESEVWLEYDENGNLTHSKVADIYDDWATREYWFTYDSEGKGLENEALTVNTRSNTMNRTIRLSNMEVIAVTGFMTAMKNGTNFMDLTVLSSGGLSTIQTEIRFFTEIWKVLL